ncbi:hypothetical protein QTP70_029509 [Hemibagrus guttatus]|uniref:Uncharacterized protein n=1 Tax=Hemibagrus guttatus TaxID=175788 RepID=A0AAE0QVW5_9TELE|nr:hypothetical protein QTP70_029509 [Hemibagrus guttatus]
MVMADPSVTLCERLTRQHGVCIVCVASVGDCCVAVGNVVGHENIVSASRMNSAIVVFLNDVDKDIFPCPERQSDPGASELPRAPELPLHQT